MVRHYRAFLLRCWQLGGGDQRFEITHIQSGDSVRATTLADAITWIAAHLASGQVPGDAPPESDAHDDESAREKGGDPSS
ncbi:MAG: hypothetical protein AVDCRST_MAG18-2977 [uncultured Thermomicrobiales bacterium]|uniref:Uncharacterized protein n=1 Tax=uncultured Thermomicrobiales bacterium TaxID=1645740 RepID=A0A6J4VHQ9_9BACT|nr:MAG: hypothetical protein AVDCRST_MAG18-2977 [uncultured Thermomicrobiales bacterium]